MHDELFAANRRNWDERAPIHAASQTYDLQRFVDDPDHISRVIDGDRDVLGDLTGQRAVHLQCHIGSDTIGLARLGAEVTGLDQSAASLAAARRLFADAGEAGTFVEARVDKALDVLPGESFDLVYTGVGALNWLPDVAAWAAVVRGLLAPGGRLVMREGHPMLWALEDERDDELLVVGFPYFQTVEPMAFDSDDTYTEGGGAIANTRTYEWNHGLGEIVTALLDQGLQLAALTEHRTLEWPFLPQMVTDADGRYVLPEPQRDLVPLMYTLVARRHP